MSEHYDFHYQPTGSGAISGQQVLEQTEDAINELGDYVYDNVGGAMDVAQEALETAQNAQNDAQTALDTANSFSDAIQSAHQDASTALSTAQTAQTTATNANATAIQASQDASSAVTTANNASGQVSTLSGTVTALGQRVTTAEGNIGQNTSDITALTTRVGTAEGNITTLQNDVTIAQGNASSAMATAGTVKQQSYVLRYSSTTLVASSTNSNTLLDNTDNLKVGDKVIDNTGNIYVVTAIDTANSTFTIGTSLIDLAQDSDVVHKSGDETVSGTKTFDSNTYVYNSDNTATTPNLYLRSSKIEISSQGNTSGDQNLTYLDKNNTTYAYVKGAIQSNGSAVKIRTIAKDSSDNSVVNELQILAYTNGNKAIFPTYSNETDLGVSNYKWKSIYATNYYYGNDNVEFSTKFVTTDTAQTVSGSKTFSENVSIYNSNTSVNTKYLILKNQKVKRGSTTETGTQFITFHDKDNGTLVSYDAQVLPTGNTQAYINVSNSDANSQRVIGGVRIVKTPSETWFIPDSSNNVSSGLSNYKWKDVQTYKINALEPSSLSLPDLDNGIDISSYITVVANANKESLYTPPANGWISVALTRTGGLNMAVMLRQGNFASSGHNIAQENGTTTCNAMLPVKGGVQVSINSALADGIDFAYFYPCLGNV